MVDLNKVFGKGDSLSFGAGITAFFLAVILYIADMIFLWNGYPIEELFQASVGENLIRILFITSIITVTVVFARKNSDRPTTLWTIALVSLWFLILTMVNRNPLSALHLLFIVIIFLLLKNAAQEHYQELVIMFIVLTIMDFFGFAALKGVASMSLGINELQFSRFMIPLLLVYTTYFNISHNRSGFFTLMMIGVVIFIVLMWIDGLHLVNARADTIDQSLVSQLVDNVKRSAKLWFVDTPRRYWREITNEPGEEIDEGEEDVLEYPQGVFLTWPDERLPVFEAGEPFYVWTRVEGRTIKGTMNVKMGCRAISRDNTYEGEIDEPNIIVFSYVQRRVPCRLTLPEGRYEVFFDAEFDFVADGSKRIYFMDISRMQSEQEELALRGIPGTHRNLLEFHGYRNTRDIATVSSGPLNIGIGSDSILWDIHNNRDTTKAFGIKLTNKWTDGGHPREISNIYLIVPEAFSFKPSLSCDFALQQTQSQAGYKTYVVTSPIGEIDRERTFSCQVDVSPQILSRSTITRDFIRTKVEYIYYIEQSIAVNVEGGLQEIPPENNQVDVCCMIEQRGIEPEYRIMQSQEACTNQTVSGYVGAYVVDRRYCDSRYCCFEQSSNNPYSYYNWIEDSSKCVNDYSFGIYRNIVDKVNCP
jgi:hypothetical protein